MATTNSTPAKETKTTKASEKNKSVFEVLSSINLDDKVKIKKTKSKKTGKISELKYVPWALAWSEVKKVYPSAHFEVLRPEGTQRLYFDDGRYGWVETEITIEGEKQWMHLPIMNLSNAAKLIADVDVCDVNKSIMRCLVKNLAAMGLGINVYNGTPFPEDGYEDEDTTEPTQNNEKPADTEQISEDTPVTETENNSTETSGSQTENTDKSFDPNTMSKGDAKAILLYPFPVKWNDMKGKRTCEVLSQCIVFEGDDKSVKLKNKDSLFSCLDNCLTNGFIPNMNCEANCTFEQFRDALKVFCDNPEKFINIINNL